MESTGHSHLPNAINKEFLQCAKGAYCTILHCFSTVMVDLHWFASMVYTAAVHFSLLQVHCLSLYRLLQSHSPHQLL